MLPTALALGALLAPAAALHAPLDLVDQLLADGQRKLVAGETALALELFQQAAGQARGASAARAELWVLRAHMALGRKNDAMGRAEELERQGALSERQADYLRGSFSYILAEELVSGGSRNNPGYHYADAQRFLELALGAAPDAYLDGWRTLASAARKNGDGAAAEKAVREALKRLPDDAATHSLGAEILVANGVAGLSSEDAAAVTAARAKVREGIALADRAVALLGEDKRQAYAIASAHLQRGVAALWLEDKDLAAEAYAAALGFDHSAADFRQLWGALQDADQRPGPFVAVLTDGARRFEQRWGQATSADATLLWWLAYGEQALAQYEAAEAHYLTAVKKFPAYTNAWWHAGLCRYFRQDYAGAVKHWREHASASREDLVATVTGDLATNDAILAYVEGKRYGDATDAAGTADAAFVAEVRVQSVPTSETTHKLWNNLGLFCRDTGDLLRRARKEGDDHKTVSEYYELAYRAYERANELRPGMPYYMNDWAVILHYCLDRDHQRALDLYAQATEVAERMLKQGGLDKDEQSLVEIALRDSKNNRARLVRTLEERKKREQGGAGGGGGQD